MKACIIILRNWQVINIVNILCIFFKKKHNNLQQSGLLVSYISKFQYLLSFLLNLTVSAPGLAKGKAVSCLKFAFTLSSLLLLSSLRAESLFCYHMSWAIKLLSIFTNYFSIFIHDLCYSLQNYLLFDIYFFIFSHKFSIFCVSY